MRYQCLSCGGHVEMDGYDGRVMDCPHCGAETQFEVDTPPLLVSEGLPMADVRLAPMALGSGGMPTTLVQRPMMQTAQRGPAFVRRKAERLLTPGETVLGIAAQWFPVISVNGVVLTTRRLLLVRVGMFGLRVSFSDWLWIDVLNVRITEGILGTQYLVETVRGSSSLEMLHKTDARAVYRLGQEISQAARAGRWQYEMQTLEKGSAVLRR
jgi:hypothetical protein